MVQTIDFRLKHNEFISPIAFDAHLMGMANVYGFSRFGTWSVENMSFDLMAYIR